MSEPVQHKPRSVYCVAMKHMDFLEFYCMCYQESLSCDWLAGMAVKVLSIRESLEQLTACSLCQKKHMLLSVFCPVCFVAWEWLLVLEVVVWSSKSGRQGDTRQKCPCRQLEMVRLRNQSVRNLYFLLFILFMCAGLAEKWVGRLN